MYYWVLRTIFICKLSRVSVCVRNTQVAVWIYIVYYTEPNTAHIYTGYNNYIAVSIISRVSVPIPIPPSQSLGYYLSLSLLCSSLSLSRIYLCTVGDVISTPFIIPFNRSGRVFCRITREMLHCAYNISIDRSLRVFMFHTTARYDHRRVTWIINHIHVQYICIYIYNIQQATTRRARQRMYLHVYNISWRLSAASAESCTRMCDEYYIRVTGISLV